MLSCLFCSAFTDFVALPDWDHGHEGTGVWSKTMAREEMITGGPALRLDATIFSNMRPHRAAAPPVGVPVVKLFAVVRLVGATSDLNNDHARFGSINSMEHPPDSDSSIERPVAIGCSSPKKPRREDVRPLGASGVSGFVGEPVCRPEAISAKCASPLTASADDTVHEDGVLDSTNESDSRRFFREAREERERGEQEKAEAEFAARRAEVGYLQALEELNAATADGFGRLANSCRKIVRSMDEDNTGDEGLIRGASGDGGRPVFDPDRPYRIEFEYEGNMFTVVYDTVASDGTIHEVRDIQAEGNLSSEAVAAFRTCSARASADGTAAPDDVVSVGSSTPPESLADATPGEVGFELSQQSYHAIMSLDGATGCTTKLANVADGVSAGIVGLSDVATPTSERQAVSAAKPFRARKTSRKTTSATASARGVELRGGGTVVGPRLFQGDKACGTEGCGGSL